MSPRTRRPTPRRTRDASPAGATPAPICVGRRVLLLAAALSGAARFGGCVARNPGLCACADSELAQATPRAIAETYAACETASFNEDCRERMRQELVRRGALTPGEWDAVNGARGVEVGDHAAVVLLRAGVPPSRIAVERDASPRIERWTYSRPGLFAKDPFVVITDDRVSEVGAGRAGFILPVLPSVW